MLPFGDYTGPYQYDSNEVDSYTNSEPLENLNSFNFLNYLNETPATFSDLNQELCTAPTVSNTYSNLTANTFEQNILQPLNCYPNIHNQFISPATVSNSQYTNSPNLSSSLSLTNISTPPSKSSHASTSKISKVHNANLLSSSVEILKDETNSEKEEIRYRKIDVEKAPEQLFYKYKGNYCPFCFERRSKICLHMERNHSDKMEVTQRSQQRER